MSQHMTNTKINTSKSDYKVITKEIYQSLVDNIPYFNQKSKVAYIHRIEWDRENGMLHIYFDYFGDKEPNGRALSELLRSSSLSDNGMNLTFYHDFLKVQERNREHSKEWSQNNRELINKRQREARKRRIQDPLYRKRELEYHREYTERNRERINENHRRFSKTERGKQRIKRKNSRISERMKTDEQFRNNRRYMRYLKDHGLNEEEFSMKDYLQKMNEMHRKKTKGEIRMRIEENAQKRGFESDAQYQRYYRARRKNPLLTVEEFVKNEKAKSEL